MEYSGFRSFSEPFKMTVAERVATVATKVATPENKMNFIRMLIGLHKVKRFGKSKSEPAFQVFRKHPITRGMASYLFMWPLGNIVQQSISNQEKYDWWRIIRFGLYGAIITAPSLYTWVKLTTSMYPNTMFRIGCAKVRYIAVPNPIILNSRLLIFVRLSNEFLTLES